MTTSLITDPIYALPGNTVRITPVVTGAANFVRVWLTDAPVGSLLKTRQAATGTRINPVSNDPAGNGFDAGKQIRLSLDKGGVYTFVVQEYTKGATTYGGGYASSPDSFQSETKVGTEQTVQVHIGERVEHKLGSPARGTGKLVIHVWNDTVRQTLQSIHGLDSPAIEDCSTQLALSAASDATVKSVLASMIDVGIDDVSDGLADLVSAFQSVPTKHFNNNPGGYHGISDTDNDSELEDMPRAADTADGLIRAAQVVHKRLSLHLSNGGDGSRHFHSAPDWANRFIAEVPGDSNGAVAALADAWRVYENHRVDAVVHVVADTSNVLLVSSPTNWQLLKLHKAFFAAMNALSPAAAGGTQAGVVKLSGLGFRMSR
jgi:hypothetical protein